MFELKKEKVRETHFIRQCVVIFQGSTREKKNIQNVKVTYFKFCLNIVCQ